MGLRIAAAGRCIGEVTHLFDRTTCGIRRGQVLAQQAFGVPSLPRCQGDLGPQE